MGWEEVREEWRYDYCGILSMYIKNYLRIMIVTFNARKT